MSTVEIVARYQPDLVELEPSFSPPMLDLRRELLKAEAPFIERYEFADLPGYAIVNVFADRVGVDVYAGVGGHRWTSRELLPQSPAKAGPDSAGEADTQSSFTYINARKSK